MQRDDIDRVLELGAESAEAPQWARHVYEQILASEPAGALKMCAWVVQTENQVVGFAVARCLEGEPAAEIETIAVAQAHRRRGIGTALVKASMRWAASSGAPAVRLEVRQSNAAAQALYHALGFATVAVRRAYYASPQEDAYVLEGRAQSTP